MHNIKIRNASSTVSPIPKIQTTNKSNEYCFHQTNSIQTSAPQLYSVQNPSQQAPSPYIHRTLSLSLSSFFLKDLISQWLTTTLKKDTQWRCIDFSSDPASHKISAAAVLASSALSRAQAHITGTMPAPNCMPGLFCCMACCATLNACSSSFLANRPLMRGRTSAYALRDA